MNNHDTDTDKYNTFQKDILRSNEFLNKIKDIFKLQNTENFQDILILPKQRYIERIEKEVLYIFKKIYSDKIISNITFNSLFKSGKEDFLTHYNKNYDEIHSEWESFKELKYSNYSIENEAIINTYYITDFRKHCHNHEGLAIHKCGLSEKGRFIKISGNQGRFKNNKEIKYVICEECKKVFFKDLFNNHCCYCKENYLCAILTPSENKDYFLATYTNPHCESFINKTIPCKLCKEKLYLYISDKKIKCLKCSYIIDLNIRSEIEWQCPKCNLNFISSVKIFNPSESYILTKILKKALLLKIKARPNFMNCCNLDISTTTFYHKKDCNGILYLCNVENYFLKKKWVIVCEKCHAINNCTNFIWTCPKCGKRTRETSEINVIKSPPRKGSSSHYNINKVEKNEELNNKDKEQNVKIYQKYLSNYINKKPTITSCLNDNNNIIKKYDNNYNSSNYNSSNYISSNYNSSNNYNNSNYNSSNYNSSKYIYSAKEPNEKNTEK